MVVAAKSSEEKSLGFSEKELKRYKLVAQFQDLLESASKGRTLSKTELDARRTLNAEGYFSLMLFTLFNPVIDSMRGACAASTLDGVEKTCGSGRVSLGSFSEAQSVFDPELLQEVIRTLAADQPELIADTRLGKLSNDIKLFDGSLIPALPRMAWALWQDDNNRAAKLHLKQSRGTGAVEGVVMTIGNGNEREAALKMLKAGDLGVFDRGYAAKYGFINEVTELGASLVARIRNCPIYEVVASHALDQAALQAGVISDEDVLLGKDEIAIRMVVVEVADKRLVLVTDRKDLSADLIALIYRYRWQVELFFKWIKCILGCRHLLAESPSGVAIQIYLALIAAMLLTRMTGKRPTKRQMEMLQFYISGQCSLSELEAQLALRNAKKT
jgi:hypothetical protein